MRRISAVGAIVVAAQLAAGATALAAAPRGALPRAAFEIVDSLGRKVAVPGKVERIISLSPEATRVIVALGAGDRLVGIDFFLRHHDRVFSLVFPQGARLPVVSNQGQELHYEEAVRLRPDLVIASPSEAWSADTMAKKLRAPVAALASMGRLSDLVREIEVLGRMLGREDKAAGLVAYLGRRLDEAGPVPAGGPGTGPKVYLSFWGSLVRTPVSYEPVEAAGGRNVASGLVPDRLGTASLTVSLEQLFVWDPDIILIQGNYSPDERRVTVEGVLRDPRLASLRAVRDGRVHYTFGFWYWWDPALVVVETLYLARLFASGPPDWAELARKGDEVFREIYGVEGAFAALCRELACHEWTKR
jgi:iron complex transport system substrate-binding protein